MSDDIDEALVACAAYRAIIDKLKAENDTLREQLKLETEKANARFDYAYELQTENAKLQKYVDYIERYADELTVNAAREEAQS